MQPFGIPSVTVDLRLGFFPTTFASSFVMIALTYVELQVITVDLQTEFTAVSVAKST